MVAPAANLTPRLQSSYYGHNQRAWSRLDAGAAGYTNNGVPTNVLDRMELFYYDASWRLLERRTDESWNGTSFVHDSTSQWVWGQRYIDELVASITDGDANDEFEDLFYAMTDRNFSVIGLSQSTGGSGERIRYDAYGHAQASPPGDANGDGAVNIDDQDIVLANFGKQIGDTGYKVEADFDSNGVINKGDLSTVDNNFGQSIDRGRLSGSGNIVGYAGYIFEPATGMYVVRHRWYSTENGRWLSRDPLDYLDGQNHFAYVSGRPVATVDPMGLMLANPAGSLHGYTYATLVNLFQQSGMNAIQYFMYLVAAGVPVAIAAEVTGTDGEHGMNEYIRQQELLLEGLEALLASGLTLEEAEEAFKKWVKKRAEALERLLDNPICEDVLRYKDKVCGPTGAGGNKGRSNPEKSKSFSCSKLKTGPWGKNSDCDKFFKVGTEAKACAAARGLEQIACYGYRDPTKKRGDKFRGHVTKAVQDLSHALNCFKLGRECQEAKKLLKATDPGC